MKKNLLVFLCCMFIQFAVGQIREVGGGFDDRGRGIGVGNVDQSRDTLPDNEIDVKLSGKTKYTDYKIISHKRDTTIIDTTLTIQKYYKFNFIRKDDFELLPFHNQGQTFNSLAYDFNRISMFPDIGFRAKQFNFIDIDEVKYYQVPTPTSEILYRGGLEQGQVLDALFTTNFSKRFNVALSYRGLRSLGKYRRSLASSGNFRLSFHYSSPKGQYEIRGHAVNQDFLNQENGGLTEESLTNFITDNPNFSSDRGRLDVNLNDAESVLEGKRLFIEQSFKLLANKDTLNNKDFSNLKVGHIFISDGKFFKFKQNSPSNLFGEERAPSELSNQTDLTLYDNQLFLDFNSKYVLGRFRVKSGYVKYNYGYQYLQNNIVDNTKNKLKGDAVYVGADWNGKVKDFYVNASASLTPGSGRLAGNNLQAEAFYKKDSLFTIKAKFRINNKQPNFNFLLHQSVYNKFNWDNNLGAIGTRVLGGEITSKWGNASLDITNIDNYTYFNKEGQPQQYSGNINYLKLKVGREFKFGKFALDNTLMYQKVASGSEVLRVPDFVTRNALYYSDNWFKGNPLFIQIGASLKYFTNYKANAYNPLLGEFILQDDTEVGYPTVDLFVNGRVRRTRIYFKADNISSFFLKKNYFSAPNYPYRDFVIRFGVVWNWFI